MHTRQIAARNQQVLKSLMEGAFDAQQQQLQALQHQAALQASLCYRHVDQTDGMLRLASPGLAMPGGLVLRRQEEEAAPTLLRMTTAKRRCIDEDEEGVAPVAKRHHHAPELAISGNFSPQRCSAVGSVVAASSPAVARMLELTREEGFGEAAALQIVHMERQDDQQSRQQMVELTRLQQNHTKTAIMAGGLRQRNEHHQDAVIQRNEHHQDAVIQRKEHHDDNMDQSDREFQTKQLQTELGRANADVHTFLNRSIMLGTSFCLLALSMVLHHHHHGLQE
jgi:hypothetical protein